MPTWWCDWIRADAPQHVAIVRKFLISVSDRPEHELRTYGDVAAVYGRVARGRTVLNSVAGTPSETSGSSPDHPKRCPRSMTIQGVRDIRAKLASDDQAIGRDLPHFVAFMLATGCGSARPPR